MLFSPRKCPLEPVVASLEARVKALEASAGVHQVERDHLLGLLSSSEGRLRAMLGRAESLTKPQETKNGHSGPTMDLLDRAIAARKGY